MNKNEYSSSPLRGTQYAKDLSERTPESLSQPKRKKYPIIGTNKSANLTEEQVSDLVQYGDIFIDGRHRLVLDNNRLRIERASMADDLVTDILKQLADQGINTTGTTAKSVYRGK